MQPDSLRTRERRRTVPGLVRLIYNNQRMTSRRAAMGKTKVSMPQGRIVNVSLADWTVIESDSNVQGLLMVSGTNIPAGSIPI